MKLTYTNNIFSFFFHSFLQSIAAATSFVYSSHLGLHAQMGILLAFGIMGTISFCLVEWGFKRNGNNSQDPNDKLKIEVHSD